MLLTTVIRFRFYETEEKEPSHFEEKDKMYTDTFLCQNKNINKN